MICATRAHERSMRGHALECTRYRFVPHGDACIDACDPSTTSNERAVSGSALFIRSLAMIM